MPVEQRDFRGVSKDVLHDVSKDGLISQSMYLYIIYILFSF